MRSGDDDAAVGVQLARKQRHGGRGNHSGKQSVATGAGDARNNGRFQHVAAFARVLAEHDGLAHECNGSLSQAVCEFARQIDVCDAAHTVGSEKSSHEVLLSGE